MSNDVSSDVRWSEEWLGGQRWVEGHASHDQVLRIADASFAFVSDYQQQGRESSELLQAAIAIISPDHSASSEEAWQYWRRMVRQAYQGVAPSPDPESLDSVESMAIFLRGVRNGVEIRHQHEADRFAIIWLENCESSHELRRLVAFRYMFPDWPEWVRSGPYSPIRRAVSLISPGADSFLRSGI